VTDTKLEKRALCPGLVLQLFAAAFIGVQFALLEGIAQRRAGFVLDVRSMVEIGLWYLASGLALGLAAAVVTRLLLALLPRSFHRLLMLGPSLFVIFVMAATTISARDIRTLFHPVVLAKLFALLIGVLLVGWIWSRRRWSHRIDAALLGVLILADTGLWIAAPNPGKEIWVPRSERQPVVAAEDAPNIFIILLDAVRPDHMGIYGYERETTPHIDALAAKGTVFERAYSPSNWTRPVVASLHSSTMPSRHGVIALDRALPPSLPLLAQQLKRMGYQNGFVTIGVNIEPEDGYGRGVDYFYYAIRRAALERTPMYRRSLLFQFLPGARALVRPWLRGGKKLSTPEKITDQVLAWARHLEADRPAFMYVHYGGGHGPYRPPSPYNRAFTESPPQKRIAEAPLHTARTDAPSEVDLKYRIAQYDGLILWHDFEVGRLLDELRALGRLDRAIVVIIADHGEAFGEHGVWAHGEGLFEEVARVPLILWSTQPWNKSQRLQVPVSLMDLAPTLIDLIGGKVPASWDGRSLKPWLLGERKDVERVVFQENVATKERGLRNAQWAYFERELGGELRQWLYRADDRRQENDVSGRYPDLVEKFHQLVTKRAEVDKGRGAAAPLVKINPARREQLRALGYID
jgi:arylsulfatase A-like enzyme